MDNPRPVDWLRSFLSECRCPSVNRSIDVPLDKKVILTMIKAVKKDDSDKAGQKGRKPVGANQDLQV